MAMICLRQTHVRFLFLLVLLGTIALITTSAQIPDSENEIFCLKRTIETDMKLTRSLTVSPISSHFVVASADGTIKVFNYESTQTVLKWDLANSSIISILWQNDHQGLVITSTNTTSNTSNAIQYNSLTFQQVYRWQFSLPIQNADSISNKYESYIAFNFITYVQEYHLKTHKKSMTYKPAQGHSFAEMSYSSHYAYLYLSGHGQYIYAFKCGTIYRFFQGTSDIITRFQADRYNNQHSPVIYKKQYTGYEVLDPNYQFNATFPKENIRFFRYCPKDYILGVAVDKRIIIYSRDYKFVEKGVIDTFANNEGQILAVVCQNGRIIVSNDNSKVYVFELKTTIEKQSQGWIYVVAIGAGVTLLLILVSVYVVMKLKKKRRESKRLSSPSLLTSEPKSSVISEFIN